MFTKIYQDFKEFLTRSYNTAIYCYDIRENVLVTNKGEVITFKKLKDISTKVDDNESLHFPKEFAKAVAEIYKTD